MLKRVPLIDSGREHRILSLHQLVPGTDLEPQHVESMRITMVEDFGMQGRGSFCDQTGHPRCLTDRP